MASSLTNRSKGLPGAGITATLGPKGNSAQPVRRTKTEIKMALGRMLLPTLHLFTGVEVVESMRRREEELPGQPSNRYCIQEHKDNSPEGDRNNTKLEARPKDAFHYLILPQHGGDSSSNKASLATHLRPTHCSEDGSCDRRPSDLSIPTLV